MFFAFIQIIRSNVDDIAADRLRRANGKSQVLMTLVDAEVYTRLARLVYRLLVDRVFLREVYQLATTIKACVYYNNLLQINRSVSTIIY